MKKINFIAFVLLAITNTNAQIGINTPLPKTTLDVEGDLRVATTNDTGATFDYVLTVDENQIVQKTHKSNIITGKDVTLAKTFAIIPKLERQLLATKDTFYDILFDGAIQGLNTNVITISTDKTTLNFPADKAFKVTAMIGIRQSFLGNKDYPGYITSEFVAGTGLQALVKTKGYVESSTEAFDDGGVSNPIIIFTTGPDGGKLTFKARYGGLHSGTSGYYLAGPPSDTSLGSYFLIEEL